MKTETPRKTYDIASSRKFGNKHALAVADFFRLDMLIKARVTIDRADMDTALMGESGFAHKSLPRKRFHIHYFIHIRGSRGNLPEHIVGQTFFTQFHFDNGNDGTKIGIAAPLADAVHRALNVRRSRLQGGERIGDGKFAVVMGVNAERRFGQFFLQIRTICETSEGSVPPLESHKTSVSAPAL